MTDSRQRHLGFYSLNETRDKNGYLGALLVTDTRGRPEEFRVTYPVKPSAFQRPLYGSTLGPFIGVELCGKQLVKRLDHVPGVLFVKQRFLLDVRDLVAYPVVQIRKVGETIEVKTEDAAEQSWIKRQLNSSSGRFQPIEVVTASEHEDDLHRARDLLEEAFAHMNLVEPFSRIDKALELLAKEDQRFV